MGGTVTSYGTTPLYVELSVCSMQKLRWYRGSLSSLHEKCWMEVFLLPYLNHIRKEDIVYNERKARTY